jgi:hypothetical protein
MSGCAPRADLTLAGTNAHRLSMPDSPNHDRLPAIPFVTILENRHPAADNRLHWIVHQVACAGIVLLHRRKLIKSQRQLGDRPIVETIDQKSIRRQAFSESRIRFSRVAG